MTTITLVKTEPQLRHSLATPVLPVLPVATPAPQSAFTLSITRAPVYPARGHCPVCYRAACPLKTHRQYARSRRLHVREPVSHKRPPSSNLSTPPTEESADCHCGVHRRMVGLGGAKVDCFIEFPLPKGVKAEVHQLFQDFFVLHQTKSTTGPKAGPSPLTSLMREILPACSNSPALCQSIVAASAVWHGSYRGHCDPDTRTLFLHGQALQAFRKALSNPSTAYSDATILAAACLTHHQVLIRNRLGLKAHVDGVQTLVEARGGLHNVGWVAHILLWIDYYTCLYVDQEPRFTWPMDNNIHSSFAPDKVYGSAFESLQLQVLLDPALRHLCIEVCRIIEILESSTGAGQVKSAQDYYRYKRTTMGVQLGHLHARFHGQGTIDECVSLTLNIIVLKVFYMHVLDETRMDLCHKLRIALELTGLKSLQYDHMDLLTWMLFAAGALAPNASPRKGWFVNRLRDALAAHFTSAMEQSIREIYLKGYVGKVVVGHAWSAKLLTPVLEMTLGLLLPHVKKPLHDEKKIALAAGLFPG